MNPTVYRSGDLIFAVIMITMSVFLLYSIPAETKWFKSMALTKQPRLWPAMCIVGMIIFGVAYGLKTHFFAKQEGVHTRNEIDEFLHWFRPLEFVAYFMIYVVSVPWLGYLLATILYFILMTLRAGYRESRMLVVSVVTAITVVIVFKSLLQVKISAGAWYDLLPDAWANFMIVYF